MVNVTMLVHNRPALTEQALESIGNSADLTITVRLDNILDREIFDMLMCDWKLKADSSRKCLVMGNEIGTGSARNAVIQASQESFGRGDYLYLSDNDVFFKPGWLERLIRCYEATQVWGVKVLGAYNHPYHQLSEECFHVLDPVTLQDTLKVHSVHALALQSMLMRWEVWDKYGPFCETPVGRVCASEDVDFARKITADGGKLGVVSPALVVNTGITNSFGEKIPGWELVEAQCPPGVLCL